MVILFFLCLLSPHPLWAHRVEIYAWVEGEKIFTKSVFSGGHSAAHSKIEVFDNNGKRLITGKTDSQGMFSFPLPKNRGLRIVLHSPTGHGAELKLKAGEIPIKTDHQQRWTTDEDLPISPVPCMSREEMRALMEEVLDEKLGPVQKSLAMSQKRGPGITEILGGIGYIVGLMGLAIAISRRKKPQSTDGGQKD